MAEWPFDPETVRAEAHYGDRVVPCRIDRPGSLGALLDEAVARNTNGEALVCGAFRATWTELDALVWGMARRLGSLGIGPGNRVVLFMGNCSEFVIALFAVARLGAISVPVGVREQQAGLAYIIADSGAKAIVHDTALIGQVPDVATIVRVEVGEGAAIARRQAGTPFAVAQVDEEAPALIMYTSGTTGKPKGAIVTHLAIVHGAMIYGDTMGCGPADRFLCTVPLSHVTGICALLATATRAAGTLLLLDGFNADAFIKLAAAERMTHTVLVPAMYNLLLQRVDLAAAGLEHWRIGGFGGAIMPHATIKALKQALPNVGLVNCYGATETVVAIGQLPPHYVETHGECVGLAVPCTSLRVMDEQGREVPRGEQGELWVAGPTITKGYWRNEAATAENVIGGWWQSGDIVSIDSEGFVRVHDRLKDMINRGGFKVYSAEVESVLLSHAAVREAAVVGRPCPVLGERVHAYITLHEGCNADETALLALCAEQLAGYKVPETVMAWPGDLPRNANGKIMKNELRAHLGEAGQPERS